MYIKKIQFQLFLFVVGAIASAVFAKPHILVAIGLPVSGWMLGSWLHEGDVLGRIPFLRQRVQNVEHRGFIAYAIVMTTVMLIGVFSTAWMVNGVWRLGESVWGEAPLNRHVTVTEVRPDLAESQYAYLVEFGMDRGASDGALAAIRFTDERLPGMRHWFGTAGSTQVPSDHGWRGPGVYNRFVSSDGTECLYCAGSKFQSNAITSRLSYYVYIESDTPLDVAGCFFGDALDVQGETPAHTCGCGVRFEFNALDGNRTDRLAAAR